MSDVVQVVIMAILVFITGYYAWQTRETVNELKNQRIESANQEVARRQREIVGLQNGLRTELSQILITIQEDPGIENRGRGFTLLPNQSWRAIIGHPDAISAEARAKLLDVYAEVDRVNAVTEMMLRDPHSDRNPVGENWTQVRSTASGPLRQSIHEALGLLDGLP